MTPDEEPHPDPHQAVGAYALHALPPDEEAVFERHLDTCAACRRELAELTEAAARPAERSEHGEAVRGPVGLGGERVGDGVGVEEVGDGGRGGAVPEGVAAQHGMVTAADEGHARVCRRVPRPAHIGRRVPGRGDVVPFAVQDDESAAGQLLHRLARRAPRRQGQYRAHARVRGGAQCGPAAHGVADQHGGHRAGEFGDPAQRPVGVRYGVGVGAVPALEAVAHAGQQDVLAAQFGGQRPQERVHAQCGEVPWPGRAVAELPSAVQDQHRRPGPRRKEPWHERGRVSGRGRQPGLDLGPCLVLRGHGGYSCLRLPSWSLRSAPSHRRGGRGKNPLVRATYSA
ncbi:zf-HC2 domain-containing protein [Streptomyces phaeolivaceus]|uniref:Zf-HC2 domain-containing protein n=1 Tax=Streptomyces phaeolivaceus TaxID=2653200 RepID=A0A5P8KH62_9ACTN|nr:zf-HC2 domain-containing protein [Streptomyces phaeolivaceus]